MGGRADYEERRERRIERYKELSEKTKQKSEEYANSNANRILQMTSGQPIIIGHHSERKHRRLIDKANNDIRKSIEMDDKSKYYADRAKSAENSKVIYSDDPMAIEKLKKKLEQLENEKESIKKREHSTWELTNIGANIRNTKDRIKRLEEQENLSFNDIDFNGGRVIHNREINRIQLIFDDIPSEEIRNQLKHNGFHWSRKEKAWQREFNKRTIYATNKLLEDVLSRKEEIQVNEKQEEEEFE